MPYRLDAVALTLFVGLLSLAAVVGLHGRVPLGPVGDAIAAAVRDGVGGAGVVLLIGGLAVLWQYVWSAGPSKLLARSAGWLTLAVTAAVVADHGPRTVSVYGSGGAVGAWLRLTLDATVPAPLPWLVVAAATVIGLSLAWPAMMLAVARRLGRGSASLSKWIERFAAWITTPREKPAVPAVEVEEVEVVPLAAAEEPTIRVHAEPEPEEAVAEEPEPAREPVPIHRPAPPLRVVPADDDTPIETRASFELPSLALLADPDPYPVADHEQKLRDRAVQLEKTFQDFDVNVKVVGIHTGPVITQYEISLETGLRLNRVTALADDIALNLGVASVRIVAPLPNRSTVGVEVPNEHRQTVRLKELIQITAAKAAKFKLPIFLGKDVEGRPLVYDMAAMPHLLIAGRTGTGKSVCLNAVLQSFLFTRSPEECRLILIDPKKVEFSDYGQIPHLMHPVVTDDKKAEAILAWAVDKMEERYEQLRKARVRNVAAYNDLGWDEIVKRVDPPSEEERQAIPRTMPYIVVVVDEVGDLLMSMKKEVESHIIRLAQKSRAAGIHLILATQKPTVDVITGLIKSNLPARICFQVASRADSAVVLDEKGAEKLLGMGDMLFLQPGTGTCIRGQGAYVDDREIARVTEALAVYEPNFESELLNLKAKDTAGGGDLGEKLRDRDPLYEQAVEIVIREQRGSTSLLQRAMGVGYGRASRLIDFMAEDGIVGAYNGSNAREVLVTPDEWQAKRAGA